MIKRIGLKKIMALKEMFEEFLKLKGLSVLSMKAYLYYLGKFGGLDNFNQKYINRFVLQEGNHPPVRAFINNLRTCILTNGSSELSIYIEGAGKVELPKKTGAKKKDLPDILHEEEVLKVESGFSNERNKIMLHLNFYLGLRVNELVNIGLFDFQVNWDDVKSAVVNGSDLIDVSLKIRGKRSKERMEYVSGKLLKRIYLWLMERDIGGSEGENTPIFDIGERRWQILLKKASISTIGKDIHPHTLRHSCATWLLKVHKWDLKYIAEYLGHDSVSTTEIYTRIENEDLKDKCSSIYG